MNYQWTNLNYISFDLWHIVLHSLGRTVTALNYSNYQSTVECPYPGLIQTKKLMTYATRVHPKSIFNIIQQLYLYHCVIYLNNDIIIFTVLLNILSSFCVLCCVIELVTLMFTLFQSSFTYCTVHGFTPLSASQKCMWILGLC